MPKRFDDATFIFATDGSLYVHVHDRDRAAHAHTRFPPSQLLPLRDWLTKSASWLPDEMPSLRNERISYSHETGLLTVSSARGNQTFDPNSEEALARLVRKLKALAPIPHGDPPLIPNLPNVTDEDLQTKRQIFSEPMAASGAKKPRKRKSEPVKPSIADEKASALLDDILMDMILS